MTETIALLTKGLKKAYREHAVLKGIDLCVPEGSVFALLGVNGAGKTTTINILTTLLTPDEGTAIVAGYDVQTHPAQVRDMIAVTGQNVTVDTVLTGFENLVLVGRLRHVENPQETATHLLERFGLAEAANKRVETYSGGMKRRLDIALSLVGEPQIIFLDEPTTGLDPIARREVWNTIETLAQEGVTIILTTQYMEEAERLADTIAVLNDGHIVATGNASYIKQFAGDAENLEEAFLTLTATQTQNANISPDDLNNAETYALMTPKTTVHQTRVFKDTWTLTVRMLKHNVRSMDTIMTVLGMPLLTLLAFVYVLGGAMSTGTIRYVDYIVPTVLLICIAGGVAYTAFRVNLDAQGGMFDRLKAMPLARPAIMGGHALASIIVNALSCVIILLVALLIGYHPEATIWGWIVGIVLLLLSLCAFTALGTAFGVIAKTAEGSGMFSYVVIGLLFVSSGFAPTTTMPAPLQVFADYQPMTPVINAIRDSLLGLDPGVNVWVAIVWLVAFTLLFSALGIAQLRKRR